MFDFGDGFLKIGLAIGAVSNRHHAVRLIGLYV